LRQQIDQLESEKGVLLDYVQESVEKTNTLNKELLDLESKNKTLTDEKTCTEDQKSRSEDELDRWMQEGNELRKQVSLNVTRGNENSWKVPTQRCVS
jgi:septal ring factor EnvC (AmiA/AmiB activator)